MQTLAGLSDEVLSLILSYASLSVVTLWTAGDFALNKRIARSCRTIATEASLASNSLKKWPRMFSALRALSSLKIEVYAILEPINVIKDCVLELNTQIHELLLHFKDAQLLFLKNAGYRDDQVITTSTNPPTLSASTVESIWHIGEVFPVLTTVSICDSSEFVNNALRLSTPFFSIFPPTLTSLRVFGGVDGGTIFSQLPSGVTRLSWSALHTSVLGSDSASSLPPNLTHLDGFPLKKGHSLPFLPRTLRTGDYSSRASELSPELMAAFPPATQSIEGGYLFPSDWIDASWASSVPRSLTTLNFFAILQPSDLELLPRTITSIRGIEICYAAFTAKMQEVGQEEVHKMWPPNLTGLVVCKPKESVDASAIYIYPQSLTYLLLEGHTHFKADDAVVCYPDGIPPKLTTLVALHTFSETAIEMWDYLPASLTHIDLGGCNLWYDSLAYLHEGLLELNIDAVSFDTSELAAYIGHVPSTVVNLSVRTLHPEGFAWLPRGLTKFQVRSIPGEVSIDHLAELPPNLKQIHMAGNTFPKLSFARTSTGPVPDIRGVADRMNAQWVIVRGSSNNAPSMPSIPTSLK